MIHLQGYDRWFPSIQCLCTHYSVMKENLPCPLVFVQWKKSQWDAAPPPPPRKPKVGQSIIYRIFTYCFLIIMEVSLQTYDDQLKNNNNKYTYTHYSLRQRPISFDFIDNDENTRCAPSSNHIPSSYRHSVSSLLLSINNQEMNGDL